MSTICASFLVLPRRRVVLDTFRERFCSLLEIPRGAFGVGFEESFLHLVTDLSSGFERCLFDANRSRWTRWAFGAGEDQGYSWFRPKPRRSGWVGAW